MNIIHCAASHRSSSMASAKLIYPAANRNADPILGVISPYLHQGNFLEISSGSGQHVAHFAPHFPQVMFYPSEYENRLLESIEAHCHGLSNVAKPVIIDITSDFRTWPGQGKIFRENSFDYIYNANLMHISPFACSVGLFRNAGHLLKTKAFLFTYGPYAFNGKLTPESNVRFDENLRTQNPEWGVRDIEDLKKLARENGIQLFESINMPANNKTLIWQKV
ncbi:methyltransferase-like 26 [Copidosoma floridanum]|uniref:methyltransferase-like 26 n=1 Tax=Copidosoma floridanum TaxID=29053 RepID=UPI0006C9CABD|nr:methyltransferase-like 26 [Copidosoma floridanum]